MTTPARDRASASPDTGAGLHSPTGALGMIERPRRWTPARLIVQALGFTLGIALLLWCVSLAFSDANREELAKLARAPARLVAALLGLAALSAVFNAAAFWTAARPVHRLPFAGCLAVNFVASFLAFLPFKLSLLARVALHRRGDGMAYKDIVAWLAAFMAMSLATLLPLLAATVWRGRFDVLWALAAAGGVVACNALGVLLGRLAERRRWLATLSMGSWRVVRHPGAVAACAAWKLADTAVHAARFAVVAAIFEKPLSLTDAALYSQAYFLIGSASPVGMLGMREGGVTLLAGPDARDEIARFALTISAAEAAALGVCAIAALLWLGPRSLLRGRTPRPASPGA